MGQKVASFLSSDPHFLQIGTLSPKLNNLQFKYLIKLNLSSRLEIYSNKIYSEYQNILMYLENRDKINQ